MKKIKNLIGIKQLKYKTITLWKGKDVKSLSREELLEVIEYIGKEYFDLINPRNVKARSLGSAEMMRRGE